MAFDEEFLDMMPHTVQIAPWTGQDKFGKPTFGSDVAYRCRIVGKSVSVRHNQTEELQSIYTIYVAAGAAVITTRDRLTLPADNAFSGPGGGTQPKLFTVYKGTDDEGHHHTVIACGWMYHRQGQ
jgi:hypothetical protein